MGLYLGIFLVTLSGLMFEIGLTRIFSATIWYHYAFVAISVALLGWGLGGFALHLLRGRMALSRERAALITLLYGVSMPLALWLIVRVPFHPDRLVFYFAISLLPFLLAGAALSMLFAVEREHAARLYFADLAGASLGALAVTFLLSWLGRRECRAGGLARAARGGRGALARACARAAVLGVLVLAALARQRAHRPLQDPLRADQGPLPPHGGDPGGADRAHRLERVLADRRRDGIPAPVPGAPLHRLRRLDQHPAWDGDVASLAPKRDWYRALPFQVAPEHAKTLVIGPGGGSDVLVALGAGSEKVTAVEMNPLMLRFVRHFGAEAGNIYDHPRIETVLSEGRTFIRRSDRRFDVILMGFVDSWAAVASGGLSLSENHLYTVEAFRAYLDHLSDDGRARDPALADGRAAAGLERRGAAGAAGGRPPRRRAVREARGGPRGPAADDLHAQEAALERGRDRAHGVLAPGAGRDRAGPARRRAVRVALRRPDERRGLGRAGAHPRRSRLRRPSVLLREHQALGPAEADARPVPGRARRAGAARAAGRGLRQAARRSAPPPMPPRSSTSRASASGSSRWSSRCSST